jgi:hypothetical protein
MVLGQLPKNQYVRLFAAQKVGPVVELRHAAVHSSRQPNRCYGSPNHLARFDYTLA